MRPAGSPARNQAALRPVKQRPNSSTSTGSGTKQALKPTTKVRTAAAAGKGTRLSAHKVSLFKHARVKAMSCTAGTRNPLMSSGPLELYQIVTPAPNAKQCRQEMNYLSLGRNGNIVHPILPRLQVTRLSTGGGGNGDSGSSAPGAAGAPRFLITFYNPQRYWELEFLPSGNQGEATLAIVAEFESVISGMCDYTRLAQAPPVQAPPVQAPPRQREDDLDYLLLEDDGPSGVAAPKPTDEAINEAFKRAMQAVRPSVAAPAAAATRRFSSYVPERYAALPKRMSGYYDYRRVFSDPPATDLAAQPRRRT